MYLGTAGLMAALFTTHSYIHVHRNNIIHNDMGKMQVIHKKEMRHLHRTSNLYQGIENLRFKKHYRATT